MKNRKRKTVPGTAVPGTAVPGTSRVQDFLLEIGCEELPADYLPGALDWGTPPAGGLADSAEAVFSEENVVWKDLQSFGTPRRLVLKVSGIVPLVRKQVKGPPLQVAFDAQGKPTRAAESFAQRNGMTVPQLVRRQTPKGEMLFAEYDVPVGKVLSAAVPEIIGKVAGVAFPKTMRWDGSGARFARPVRWLLALYGDRVVPVTFGSLKAGRKTYPNRRLGSNPVVVKNAAAYFSLLPRLKVRLQEGRPGVNRNGEAAAGKKGMLHRELEAQARKLGGRLTDETAEEFEWLLNTATFLAEDPVVAVGSFRPEYLDLPAEVLATSMAKHLKLFSLREEGSEKLLPKFLAVLEGKPLGLAAVMANYDRIIEARFTDARFFYQEDTKTPLEAKIPELAKVAFHEKLGTVGDRIPRLEHLIRGIGQQVKLPADVSAGAGRAVRLCKADLVTWMVREFPSLQGTIGAHYARHDGELETVSGAILQHYRPRAGRDAPPRAPLGAVLGLADRVDALVGYLGIGLKPTGSADPYGLRRQALGLVRILIEPPEGVSFVGLSFDRLFDVSIQSWGARLAVAPGTLKRDLRAFLRERFEWFALQEALARELVAAVLAAGDDDLAGAWERLQLLRRLWAGSGDRKRKTLETAAKVAERTGRIVESVKGLQLPDAVDPAILKEPEEKELWETWNRIAPQVKEQLERRRYEEATKIYSALYPAVHAYFEKVFVMDEDEGLRRNRLALLKQIHGLLAGAFADLAQLPLPGALEN